MRGLGPGERREVRIPVTAGLARVGDEGAYMSVVGGLATEWTTLSEGINGAFHLDSRELRRLPEQRAEVEILVSRVRDHAAALASNEVTPVQLHDYWVVSRLPADEPAGVTVIGAPPGFDPQDGAVARRLLRRHVTRAVEQGQAASEAGEQTSLAVLVLVAALAHLQDEMATAALRGMNPAVYGALDLIALVSPTAPYARCCNHDRFRGSSGSPPLLGGPRRLLRRSRAVSEPPGPVYATAGSGRGGRSPRNPRRAGGRAPPRNCRREAATTPLPTARQRASLYVRACSPPSTTSSSPVISAASSLAR
jgi:hypothetical protein